MGHHRVGALRRHALVVVAAVVVAAVRLPVLAHNLLDGDERLRGVGVAVGEDREPRADGPEAVLLTYVVRARAETLLAADERRVLGAVEALLAVHKVAEELPARGHLKALEVERRGDTVGGGGGGHRAGDGLDAVLEEGNRGLRVRGDDGEGVGRGHEEGAAENHVAVGVTVGGGAEGGERARVDALLLRALARQAHLLDEHVGVRQVGVGVAPAEVRQRHSVHDALRGGAERLDDNLAGVRAADAVQTVVEDLEVGALHETLQGLHVEHGCEAGKVVHRGVDNLDNVAIGAVRCNDGQVHVGDARVDLVLLNLECALVHGVREGLVRGAAVLAVVLDAEVGVGTTGVVRGRQDEAAEELVGAEPLTVADDRAHGRGRHAAVLAHDNLLDAVRNGHLHNNLRGLGAVVAAVATKGQCAVLEGVGAEHVEDGLYEVVEVVLF
eukprot:PhM_4_TR10976/c0_g1_i1/m.32671